MSDDDRARARHAYELLQSWRWRPIPGLPNDGDSDLEVVKGWVLEARKILYADGRLIDGDRTIGQVLSGAPLDGDGAWPHAVIRDLIEELQSEDFEQGIFLGLLNSRGATFRAQNEGGKLERLEAEKYKRWSDCVCGNWGRTGSMLQRVCKYYESRAHGEDQEAEIRDDLSQ